MLTDDARQVFDSLSAKQHETLALASRHLTSKQIAIRLGVAPVTIDKRIETVRAQLSAIPRTDLLRLYVEWCEGYDQTIYGSTILPQQPSDQGCSIPQPESFVFAFEDSLRLDARTSWGSKSSWLYSGWKPSDLGAAGKLLAMLGGAAAIMVVAVLSIAFANALMAMITR